MNKIVMRYKVKAFCLTLEFFQLRFLPRQTFMAVVKKNNIEIRYEKLKQRGVWEGSHSREVLTQGEQIPAVNGS